jgi:hypothetical protein
VTGHGHRKADFRNLELHRAALAKLEAQPELLPLVLALLDRWLAEENQRPSWPWLRQWREMLSEWPFSRLSTLVLDEHQGQSLRQCSPLGPVLTPRERQSVFQAANTRIQAAEATAIQ